MGTWIRGFAVVPEQVARELIRAIRGDISQVALSRRLGYRSNVVAGWEGGHRVPTLVETLRAAEVRRIDVASAASAFAPRVAARFDPAQPSSWLDALRGSTTGRDLALRSGFSEHQIGRWLRGEAQPRLTDALVLLESLTGRVTDWVAALVPIEQVPSLSPVHTARVRVRRLVFDEPWTAAVLLLLGARQPLIEPVEPIARRLGLPKETVAAILGALADAGVVASGPEGWGVVAPLTIDTQQTEEDVRSLRRHWATVSCERLSSPQDADRFHYNVFNISTADLARIQELQARTFREIRSIVAASPSSDVTVLYVAHLCCLAE